MLSLVSPWCAQDVRRVPVALPVHGARIVLPHHRRHWGVHTGVSSALGAPSACSRPASVEACSFASLAPSPSSLPPCMPPYPSSPLPLYSCSRVHSESGVDRPFGAEMAENGTKNGEGTVHVSSRPIIPTMGHVHSTAAAHRLWDPIHMNPRSCIHSKGDSRPSSPSRIRMCIHTFHSST